MQKHLQTKFVQQEWQFGEPLPFEETMNKALDELKGLSIVQVLYNTTYDQELGNTAHYALIFYVPNNKED